MGGMFIWYLVHKSKNDDEARQKFLDHLNDKDRIHLDYLRERDYQSKEVAEGGYGALRELAGEVRGNQNGLNEVRNNIAELKDEIHQWRVTKP